ncbi:hypothetical protein BST37_16055 [Mycobacterium noviomagense]|uniref:Uncharacterized protein n=1 Tax=Mycobacterium noviomagense TaxID=459858 RepID=A0ABX3T339_9MYCO|nr:hypothetical protein BST37_16055 [Mycobacterium noviomagense]
MLLCIVVGRRIWPVSQEIRMWVIELNFAGHRFTREVSDQRSQPWRSVRFGRSHLHWRASQLRHSPAA